MRLNRRIASLAPSATLALDARVKELVRQGQDVISLAVGEPDFDTPDHIRAEGKAAIDAGFTRYTPAAGIPELREAIARTIERSSGVQYSPGQVVVSVGAKQAIFNALLALCGPGDEVVIPAPYWVSYAEQVKLAGATPVVVPAREEEGWILGAKELERALTARSRALILNNPCNPTGAVYSKDQLSALAEVAVSRGLAIISDEVYERLVYEGSHTSLPSLGPEVRKHTVLVSGVSKTYAMTGWRIGWAAAEPDVARAMVDIQSHINSHPASMAQRAALAALCGPQDPVDRMLAEFARRRDYVVGRLQSLPGLKCGRPAGAFYAFPSVKGVLGKSVAGRRLETSMDVSMVLLEEAKVAVVPGEAFGVGGYLRLSYALGQARLAEALDRMERVLRAAS
ncbi:MAG: pyridoxal phosphate-dependent aminotransferase [Acetobacteraceae bacterium]|nr:pyridoxal phosphate-dependent aminotransferase [Acetobacteraceae bacterium]